MKILSSLFIAILASITFPLNLVKGVDNGVSIFVPVDSTPDASLFQSTELPEMNEARWEQILPLVSREFYRVKDQPTIAIGKELITWGDLATFFTSISVAGGEEAQCFLNKINEEVAPFIFCQTDGTYVAKEEEKYHPAQLPDSSDIFNHYAAWREQHYQLYKMLCEPTRNNHLKAELIEQQMKGLGSENGETLNFSGAAYCLASQQELKDWQARRNKIIEAPLAGKTYGLLTINVENMQGFAKEQREKELSEPNKDKGSSINKNSSTWENFIEDHPYTIGGAACVAISPVVWYFCSGIAAVGLIAIGLTSMYTGLWGFVFRKGYEFFNPSH